jgi:hypothetical protein
MLVLISLFAMLIGGTGVSPYDIISGGPDHHAAVSAPAASPDDVGSGGPSAKHAGAASPFDITSGGPDLAGIH